MYIQVHVFTTYASTKQHMNLLHPLSDHQCKIVDALLQKQRVLVKLFDKNYWCISKSEQEQCNKEL